MKGFYLTAEQIELENPDLTSGITKKIIAQSKALNRKTGDCELIVMKHRQRRMPRIMRAIWTRLPYTGISNCWFYDEKFREADYIYIRRESVDQSFVRFLKKVKQENSNTKLILELPNYPYNLGKGRYGRFGYPYFLKNKFGVKKFYQYIDRIVTYSDHKEIFGIQAINIDNGIDMSAVTERQPSYTNVMDEIRFVGVAQVRMWHGYDRFIEGLHKYYDNGGTRKIIFHIVGDIIDNYQYEEKIKEYQLEENIILHGRKAGAELDKLYDICNIGIDAFATHRTGGQLKSSSLKTREYLAKGIPFVTSIEISNLPAGYPYVLYLPQGEEPICIEDIVEYYDSIYKVSEDYDTVNRYIRDLAEKSCDWNTTLQPVVDYLLGTESNNDKKYSK